MTTVAIKNGYLPRDVVETLVGAEGMGRLPDEAEFALIQAVEVETGKRSTFVGSAQFLRSFLLVGDALGVNDAFDIDDDTDLLLDVEGAVCLQGWPEDWFGPDTPT